MGDKKTLRKHFRNLRQHLTPTQQDQAACNLLNLSQSFDVFINSQHIAFYLAQDGELNLNPLIEYALDSNKHCYLPVLDESDQMIFCRYTRDTELTTNRFNILEPIEEAREIIPAPDLDFVCVPLVAFDNKGLRLGMGGGYYDRAFAFKMQQAHKKPFLIGIAHACQQSDALECDSWDIPLDGIISDKAVFYPL